jgi:hypothetical protein
MNYRHFTVQSGNDMAYDYKSFIGTDALVIGYYSSGDADVDGAIRFQGVTIAKSTTIIDAKLSFKLYSKIGSGTVRVTCYGLDEDNTGDFSGGFPSSRAKTTTLDNETITQGAGDFVTFEVKDIVQEIVNRSGWSSGNAMGFIIVNNGTDEDETNTVSATYDSGAFLSGVLQIKVTSDPDVTPASKSVSAPTFPTAGNYGIKISKPNVGVGTASEEDLYFTTRKKVPKVISEDEIELEPATHGFEVSAGTVSHNLGYIPSWLVYGNKDNKRFKLPRWMATANDPVAGGPQGFVAGYSNNVVIYNAIEGTIDYYYYVFIDELP